MGTFSVGMHGKPGTLEGVRKRLPYLRDLGIGAIQLMPPFEFAGDRSWGYNPAFPFAVESSYGGPDELKELVKSAHEQGIAVILDVVYNHLGPSDLDLWQFDGWSEGDKGGIYFYQDERSSTPWGETRPDYGRAEVRDFLRDGALPVAGRVPGRWPALGRHGLHLEHHRRWPHRGRCHRGRLGPDGRHHQRDGRTVPGPIAHRGGPQGRRRP